jgi:predicted AlkP superfamily phosphohydrolase/phosphomutase
MGHVKTAIWVFLLAAAALLKQAHEGAEVCLGYAGPGAGFAFLGSFLTLLVGLLMGVGSFLALPFRALWRLARGWQGFRHAEVSRVIFLGLDGFDPQLAERFMAEGKLPNLSSLREGGSYHRLRTTFPALSPVAWSTFATGVNPAKHNMFDFLNRNLKSYLPELASAKVHQPRRVLKIGRYRFPLSRPLVEMRRKSRPFWQILGEHHIPSTVIRVPITFPPDKFNGKMLSAMCTPDLLGTQGTFAFFSTAVAEGECEGGVRYPLAKSRRGFTGALPGPDNSMVEGARPLRLPFRLLPEGGNMVRLEVGGQKLRLRRGDYSPWVTVAFRAPLGVKVTGICRFLITEIEPNLSLYVTPINIDPERPAIPISHPSYYAKYLAKLQGLYSTLGMAEDTWALNEGAIDEEAFLKQAYLTYSEREAMFFDALAKQRRGIVACVFDTTDRVQHMFYRFLDGEGESGKYGKTIEDLYCRMDDLVGRTLSHVDEQTVLFVLSDHGFTSFQRGINLNSWLHQNGYLHLKDNGGGKFFDGVDWKRTKAYTFGLGGVYLNVRGREAQGIVTPGREAAALKHEIAQKLTGLCDIETGRTAINYVSPSDGVYKGPYLDAAPDLLVGYNDGYRASWDATLGRVTQTIFEDNLKAWSGDHCVDPHLVPGVLFCNRKVKKGDPGLEDIAPTALELFGIRVPAYIEGKSLFQASGRTASANPSSDLEQVVRV